VSQRRKKSRKTKAMDDVVTELAATVDRNDVNAQAPGARLRQAREERDLSREGAAARLKLDVATIAALERGELVRLGAPVFALGYLRAYARLLELPADELIADFGHPKGLSVPSLDPVGSSVGADLGRMSTGRSDGLWKSMAVAAVVVIVGLMVTVLWDRSSGELTPAPFAVVPAPVPTSRESTHEALLTSSRIEPMADEPMDEVMDDEVVDETTTVQLGAADEAAPVETLLEAHAKDTSGPRAQLVLFFSQDSWVEVRDARGEPLLVRLGRAETTHSVGGVAPFEVQLGYAPGVDITYNGSPFDMTRYAARRTAHFRVGRAGDVNDAGND
jgi:cytoskeleton protein RodZ